MAFLAAALVFVVSVGIVGMLVFLLTSKKDDAVVVRRLEAIEKSTKRGNVSLELKLVRDELLSEVPVLHKILSRWSWAISLRNFISQAGMKMKPGVLILVSAIAAAVGYLVVLKLSGSVYLALISAVGALALPFGVVASKRAFRLRQFEKGFPEAIDLLGRAVRAGHSFTTGLELIGTELQEPVAGEFRITFEEQNFGLPLRDALLNLADRVPIIDVRFFVTALMIQKETGGNLAEILDGLARVIRERFRILGEVRIRTAQGRLTAGILIALPPIMIVALRTLNPTYMRPLFHDPWGPVILAVAFSLQVIGSLVLWKIVHFEI